MAKHFGAAISSRLIPPNVGAILATVSMNPSVLGASTSMSKTSISANSLNRTDFPSMTGLPATAPTLPRPSTADPSVTTATRFPLLV